MLLAIKLLLRPFVTEKWVVGRASVTYAVFFVFYLKHLKVIKKAIMDESLLYLPKVGTYM